jgi:hypothetical protein
MRFFLVIVTIAVMANLAQGQVRPAFEVASVKTVDVSSLGNGDVLRSPVATLFLKWSTAANVEGDHHSTDGRPACW